MAQKTPAKAPFFYSLDAQEVDKRGMVTLLSWRLRRHPLVIKTPAQAVAEGEGRAFNLEFRRFLSKDIIPHLALF